MASDLASIFFSLDDFAETVTYTSSSIAVQIPAIVDFGADLEKTMVKTRARATVILRRSDISEPKYKDEIEIDSVVWLVEGIKEGAGDYWIVELRTDARAIH